MSLFRISDYTGKKQTAQKKTKLPTQSKTQRCTFCGKSGTRLKFGNEVRTLCRDHIIQLNSKDDRYEASFERASGRRV